MVEELTEDSFENIDIAFFSAGGSISKKFAPIAARAGAVVVDNSSAFRMDPKVPLVIPEINPEAIAGTTGSSRIPIARPLSPSFRCGRFIKESHPAPDRGDLSGGFRGRRGGDGRAARVDARASRRARYAHTVLPHPYAFNLFSHNTKIDPATGYNEEETKMVQETKKIFGDAEIRISATCVRVPVLRAHSEALTFECERPITPARSA